MSVGFITGLEWTGLGSIEKMQNDREVRKTKNYASLPFRASVTKLGNIVGGGSLDRSWSAFDIFLVGPVGTKK